MESLRLYNTFRHIHISYLTSGKVLHEHLVYTLQEHGDFLLPLSNASAK